MPVIKSTPADFDLTGVTDYFETLRGYLRLRPHSNFAVSHRCDIALGPLDPPAGILSTTRKNLVNLADELYPWSAINVVAVNPQPYYAGAYESPKINSSSFGEIRNLPLNYNEDEFTIHAMVKIDSVAAGAIMTEYMNVAGNMRWRLQLVSATRMYFQIFNSVGGNTSLDQNPLLNAITLVNGDIIYVKISYKNLGAGTSLASLQAWVTRAAPNDWVKIADQSSNTAVEIQTTLKFEEAPGIILANAYGNTGLPNLSTLVATYAMMRRYLTWDDSSVNKVSTTYPAIVSTTNTGAIITLDAGFTGAPWDLSTFTVDDNSQWAAAVGNEGYTLEYEIADVPSGAWSAEMTRADLTAEASANGRYLVLRLTCRSDGFNNYSIGFVSCKNAIATLVRPAINSLARDGNAGSCIVAHVAAGDTVKVYASGYDVVNSQAFEIGSAVSVGGNTTVVLDFTAIGSINFLGCILPRPASVVCQSSRGAILSEVSENAIAGLLRLAWAVTIDAVVAADKLSAQCTVTGVPVGQNAIIAWTKADGTPNAQCFTGSGTFTVTGLEPAIAFSPLLIGWSTYGCIDGIAGDSELRGLFGLPRWEENYGAYWEDIP